MGDRTYHHGNLRAALLARARPDAADALAAVVIACADGAKEKSRP